MREWSLRLRGGAKHVPGRRLDERESARGMDAKHAPLNAGHFQFGPEFYEMA